MAIELLAASVGTLIGLGIAESVAHRRRLARIPTRIHVAGTRGKSSVTRLIAAGLREAGIATAAKTTGTLARMILPDAREVPIFRPRGPNIVEQTRVVATAEALGVEAMVVECMALQPELHWVSERKLVRATHGVITNARADHLDVMGPTEADVARCLAGMIPVGGVLVTGEKRHLGILREACKDRGTRLLEVSDETLESVSPAEMAGFGHVEHRDNVALALELLAELGVGREVALRGMWNGAPDPGALTEHEIDFFGRRIVFVNAFAANDPESTEAIWEMTVRKHRGLDKIVAVFNLRADRPSRTQQIARETSFWHAADHVVLMGSGAYHFVREASRVGIGPERFVYADHGQLGDVFESIVELCDPSALVVGMANVGELGLGLVRLFRNRRLVATEKH
jgi:poly-gamma-glutamate synthase PgsB/CapB